jgi:hypothetical protein
MILFHIFCKDTSRANHPSQLHAATHCAWWLSQFHQHRTATCEHHHDRRAAGFGGGMFQRHRAAMLMPWNFGRTPGFSRLIADSIDNNHIAGAAVAMNIYPEGG